MPAANTFAAVRKHLAKLDKTALTALIGELYALAPRNRDFLNTRFGSESACLAKYKKIIYAALYPNVPGNNPVSFRAARAAISDYRKALGDSPGLAELQTYAAECATRFTADYGGIGSPFYTSLENMYADAAKTVSTLDPQAAAPFVVRLQKILHTVHDFGWGLHDALSKSYATTLGNSTLA